MPTRTAATAPMSAAGLIFAAVATLGALPAAALAREPQPAATPSDQRDAELQKQAEEAIKRAAEAAKPASTKKEAPLPAPITTPDGLIIEELTLGTGAEVTKNAAVVAHYKGTLKDGGAEFDSSIKRGQPAVFPLAGVIKGWQEGVPGMKVGGKRRLTIPSKLAYGERVIPGPDGKPLIPANSVLVFEIEIINTLVIEDIKVGDGKECPLNLRSPASVKVHYKGTLKDGGKQFDSSYDRNEPIEFSLGQVIPGWTFGVPGMKVGGKRKLTIPWQMAYGERGSGPDIPPKADLVFEIELLDVK
jgi:peptidylprolyl isomerase